MVVVQRSRSRSCNNSGRSGYPRRKDNSTNQKKELTNALVLIIILLIGWTSNQGRSIANGQVTYNPLVRCS